MSSKKKSAIELGGTLLGIAAMLLVMNWVFKQMSKDKEA